MVGLLGPSLWALGRFSGGMLSKIYNVRRFLYISQDTGRLAPVTLNMDGRRQETFTHRPIRAAAGRRSGCCRPVTARFLNDIIPA